MRDLLEGIEVWDNRNLKKTSSARSREKCCYYSIASVTIQMADLRIDQRILTHDTKIQS